MTDQTPINVQRAFTTEGVIAIEPAFDAAARPVLTVTLSDGSIASIEPTQEAFEALIARHRASA